jgi:xylulokinase
LDLTGLQWSNEIITEMGIDPALFAPLMRGATPLGNVRADAAEQTGLPATALVTVGGHDHLCGAVAVGAGSPGVLLDSIGTAEAVLLTLSEPLQGEGVAEQGYEQGAHVLEGYYGMGAYRTSGVCVDWFRSICADGVSYETLTEEAAAAPVGSLGVRFMPHMRLPHSPSNDLMSRGVFMGLSTDVTRGMMFRAILEGLSFETRNVLEPLLRYAGIDRPKEIVAIGGASRNPLFMHMKASILNQPLTVAGIEEEVATGAALLGGIGAGVYRSASEASASLNFERRRVDPNPDDAALYEQIFRDVYQGIYQALRQLDHKNAALR